MDAALATFGLGWHYETGVQILRMVPVGLFDRVPDLQLITGHWGEVVLFYLHRIDNLAGPAQLNRPMGAYVRRHVSVTPSGLWSERYLRWALEVLGPEQILISTDYPYRFTPDGGARRFLDDAPRARPTRPPPRMATGSAWSPTSAALKQARPSFVEKDSKNF